MTVPLPCLEPHDLAPSEMFAGVSTAALVESLHMARIRSLARNTTIFCQGDQADRAHLLLRGRVRIAQGDPEGGQLIVRFIGPGEIFGTMSLFTDHSYSANAITVTNSVEISWSEAHLHALIAVYPQIAINLLRIISQRLCEAQERLREVATQRVESRIAHVLLRLAEQAGHQTDTGTAIAFPLGRKDVAEMCGATLHTVSRTLTAWQKTGMLSTSQQLVTIHDSAAIRRRADERGG